MRKNGLCDSSGARRKRTVETGDIALSHSNVVNNPSSQQGASMMLDTCRRSINYGAVRIREELFSSKDAGYEVRVDHCSHCAG